MKSTQLVFTQSVFDSRTQKTTAETMSLEVAPDGKVLKIDGKPFEPKEHCGWHCYNACGTDDIYDPCYAWCLWCCRRGGCKKLLQKLAAAQREIATLRTKLGKPAISSSKPRRHK